MNGLFSGLCGPEQAGVGFTVSVGPLYPQNLPGAWLHIGTLVIVLTHCVFLCDHVYLRLEIDDYILRAAC